MPRKPRVGPGGLVYHVLNRANDRQQMFFAEGDYRDFLSLLASVQVTHAMRILAFCVMPNHWHMVLWPNHDNALSNFVGRLCSQHAQRLRAFRRTKGNGHVYQDRFKSFPVETSEYLWAVLRYVEQNPIRAGLVRRAEEWPWSSVGQRFGRWLVRGPKLGPWPVALPENWLELVNTPAEYLPLETLRLSARSGLPYGGEPWASQLTRPRSTRPRGRPRKIMGDRHS